MNKKLLYLVIIVVLLVIASFWYMYNRATSTIDIDLTVEGNYIVGPDERVAVKNGSIMTISGDLIVNGEIFCQDGPLNFVVAGKAEINGKLTCDRGEELPEGDIGSGISLVVAGDFDMTDNAEISSNGHIQLVDQVENLVSSAEEIQNIYEEIANDSGEGQRVGPFIYGQASPEGESESLSLNSISDWLSSFNLIKAAQALDGRNIRIAGRLVVPTPPAGVNQIVVVRFPNASTMTIDGFELTGPDGRDGRNDVNEKCNARGRDGQNAFRFLARAPNLVVDGFTLNLGSGGDGGRAVTKRDCDPKGTAKGGEGGKAGNFKMIGARDFEIRGAFTIYPGQSGSGGEAIAYGKDNGTDKKGGDATANGGDAEDNRKAVRLSGTVSGMENIWFGPMVGGNGGNASAFPGSGGNGVGAGDPGGNGGIGIATGGDGGDARIVLSGRGAVRTPGAEDVGGNGGDVETRGGRGGNGGVGDAKNPGGNGGNGGNTTVTPGSGGIGGDRNGNDGRIIAEPGGDGGDGGAGCPPGLGGQGGRSNPIGQDGADGEDLCLPPEEDNGGGVTTGVTPDPTEPEGETGSITVSPGGVNFEHQIGGSPCPQPIGSINLAKTGSTSANNWKITGQVPAWLSILTSGTLPTSVSPSFTCVLSQYVTQTVSTSLNVQLTDASGQNIGSAQSLNITGYIIGE